MGRTGQFRYWNVNVPALPVIGLAFALLLTKSAGVITGPLTPASPALIRGWNELPAN